MSSSVFTASSWEFTAFRFACNATAASEKIMVFHQGDICHVKAENDG